MIIKKILLSAAVGAAITAGALAVSTKGASAYVVCNRDGGDCWHSETRARAPGVRFDYHPDDWYFHQRWDNADRHFRDYHTGRGYYRNGIWITL